MLLDNLLWFHKNGTMCIPLVLYLSLIHIFACIYAFEYMKHEGKEKRYFGFAVMTVGVLTGLSMAGNLMTMYMFYEFMTLITVPRCV